jgi:hypothetical protein
LAGRIGGGEDKADPSSLEEAAGRITSLSPSFLSEHASKNYHGLEGTPKLFLKKIDHDHKSFNNFI